MTPSDNLFRLIKSLSKSEKGYFKKYVSLHVIGEVNTYVRLFDAIDAQEKYDERKIVKKFAGENFIRHLSSKKVYLYKVILKSLGAFHNNPAGKLYNMLRSVDILARKKLFTDCNKLLIKAKEKAQRTENLDMLLQILNWENKLMSAVNQSGIEKGNLVNIYISRKNILKKLNNLNEVIMLQGEILNIIQTTGPARNKKQMALYASVMKHPLLKNEDCLHTVRGKTLYNNINYVYHNFGRGDSKTALRYIERAFKLIESNIDRVNEDPADYIASLNNLLACYSVNERFKELSATVIKARSLSGKVKLSKRDSAAIFAGTYNAELHMYIKTGEFERIKNAESEIKTGLDELQNDPGIILVLRYNVMYLFFGLGDYKKSLYWLNSILNVKEGMARTDIYGFAKLFNLVIHYELGHYDLLGYIIKSTYRYFYKRNRLYKVETLLLDFIRNILPEVNTRSEQISAFKKLKPQVEKIMKSPFENQALEYFDFISWLDSKIQNRSFAEVVREKAKTISKQ